MVESMASDQTSNQTHIAPGKLHNRVETQIQRYIAEHRMIPGAQLPTEAEFCTLMKVSRSTVRHALERLELKGLISRTRGRGTFLLDAALVDQAQPNVQTNTARSNHSIAKIGVVFSYASEIDIMQNAILRGIEHAVKPRGYNVYFGRSDDWDEMGEAKAIDDLVHIGVKGFVILPVPNRTTIGVKGLLDLKVSLVLVDRYLSDLDTSYVVAENYAGTYQATEHLILVGHRRFAFVIDEVEGTGEQQLLTTSIRDRYTGYCQALRDYHLAHLINPPYAVDHTKRESVGSLLSLQAHGDQPLAIVAVNDHVATEIMNTGSQLGLKPPDDYAIVGFDDLPIASRLSVPLTTVIQPRYEIGFRAGHLLVDKMAGNTIRNEKVSLLVSMIVRQSCGAKRAVGQAVTQPAYK